MSKMAASETVRVRLQFDYPPPATPHCTVFWLLVDLNRCRVVTDLISLIRQRFGFSSGALLGLYLEGGLLPPSESARLVRDNDCLRVKLEDQGLPEALIVSNGGDSNFPCRKSKKRAFKLVEDEETDQGYKYPDKYWKRQEDSGPNEKASDLETKLFPDEVRRTKNKRKSKVAGIPAEEDEEETKKKSSKRKEKCEQKKQTRASKSPKQQTHKEGGSQNCSFPRASYRSSLAKARRRSSTGAKGSPSYLSESESCPDSVSDGHCSVTTMQGVTLSEKLSAELLKDGATKTAAANRQSSKPSFTFSSGKGKASRASSSSSDSSSESEDQFLVSKNMLEGASDFLKTTGLFAGQGCSSPGLSLETPGIMGWKPSDSNRGRQAPGPNVPVPTSLGRGWGRGEDFLFGKGLRGRGIRGRGRGRGQTVSCILNRSSESQKQKQLNDILTNSSTVIQNPVETSKKDYSLLPLLAAAPQVGEKIAFKLLELTSDYSPDVSDYKEGKILSHDPETQQVDIEVLSSLPALKEPGKFDLVYHNENGTEVVEYAVTQEKRITVFWKELIDPRLIIDSSSSISSK
ncbi:coilin, isoform CRA_a [Rattus norvegicus]|uniref:Coilin, isoform CRA_a n=3 Tax=Rattus norvegicus TaxID=10116 RepID=A6HHZ5_RAT|nr:coilin, isoform CRA_a [Rattus norvegicus]